MTQQEIMFDNTHTTHLSGWWREYDYGTHGNIMHWAYVYFGLNIADSCTYGFNKSDIGEVTYHGVVIANYNLDEKLRIPIFFNIEENYSYAAYRQEMYIKGLEMGLDKIYSEKHNLQH